MMRDKMVSELHAVIEELGGSLFWADPYRLARIVALAKHYLGDGETATRWLRRPNRALGGSTPLQSIDTELGARTVENVLGRIAYGGVS